MPLPLPLLFPPRPRPPHGDSALQARLKHLEHLVHVLRSQQRRNGPDDKAPDPDDLPREVVALAEKAGLRPGDQRYLDGAN